MLFMYCYLHSLFCVLERRIIANDSSVNPSNYSDVNSASSVTHPMAMSASSHPSSNPSLFAYRNTITTNTTVRQRAIAETTTTSLFISTERLKANTSSSMRPARQPSTVTTAAVATAAMSSVYLPSQPSPQRTLIQTIKPRIQQEKSIQFKGTVKLFINSNSSYFDESLGSKGNLSLIL